MPGETTPKLTEEILRVLKDADRPLLSSEIAEQVRSAGSPGDIEAEVNQRLGGPLATFVRQDNSLGGWQLVRTPSVTVTAPSRRTKTPYVQSGVTLPVVAPEHLERATARLEEWKKDLLDFSRRNKVLYFDTSRRTRLRLVAPAADFLYEGLALRDKSFSFPSPVAGDIDAAELEPDDTTASIVEKRGDIAVDYTTGSATDVRALQRKLYRLRSDARTVINERGINTLHVSIGALRWRENDQPTSWVTSPLVLVPVSLRHEKNKPYDLSGFEGDVVVNPALIARLRHDFALELPSFDDFDGFGEKADVLGYFESVGQVVRDKGWAVADEVWLSHFSFEKITMYEDLAAEGVPQLAAAHRVLSSIMQLTELDHPEVDLAAAQANYEGPNGYPVLDADSSQLEVLARAQAGQSLVVQGPPGTGKSQTIVNLIAQFIRDGKSVLFVSEKRAALDVVHRRLRDVGLGDLCLELHSNKANKREVVNNLFFAMQGTFTPPAAVEAAEFDERKQLRERLDGYVRELHLPRGRAGKSAFRVHGELAQLVGARVLQSPLPIEFALDLDPEVEARLLDLVRQVHVAGVWDSVATHPWRDAVFVDPPFVIRESLEPAVERLSAALADLDAFLASFARDIGSHDVSALRDMTSLRQRLDHLQERPKGVRVEWLTTEPAVFAGTAATVRSAFDLTDTIEGLEASLGAQGLEPLRAEREAVTRFRDAYATQYASLFSRLSSAYRRDKRLLCGIAGRKLGYRDAVAGLDTAHQLHERADELAHIAGLEAALGTPRPPAAAQREEIDLCLRWVERIRSTFPTSRCDPEQAARIATAPELLIAAATRLHETATAAADGAGEALAVLDSWFPSGIDGTPWQDVRLTDLSARANGWHASFDLIQDWATHFRADQGCRDSGLGSFLDEARAKGVPAADLGPALRRMLATRWISEAYREAPALAGFSATTHNAIRKRFAELDHDLVKESRKAVLQGANKRQQLVRQAAAFQDLSGGRHRQVPDRAARDEYKLIAREHEKRSRHLPLRRLLPQVPKIVGAVKPCLLMSPLSVASYLPQSQFRFDLIVFDEASQVRPADAIGAILRGQQLVVFGDNKQMPPTSFFDRQLDEEDENEEEDERLGSQVFESILDVGSTVLGAASLRWHYRSKDERLIAFSNRRFYSERPLITFPTPNLDGDTGVRFHFVPDGLYARGGSKTNAIEARAVAKLAIEHFETRGSGRSLGVIALSISQRDAIELEIRRAVQGHPELDVFMSESGPEPFFVKNLETVQGDERDSIILSLGYGPSEPGGLPALFFGPVNKSGGERRLNVAITRAKYELTLVTSMRPEQLDRARTFRNEGPKILADYVDYVNRDGTFLDDLKPGQGSPESEFEEAVWAALTGRGYQVDAQVGSSGYRIDLAVRHPDAPTRYILAVECDGAAYHSSWHARDRDRLREEVLRAQGWAIERIWSYDWIQHPGKELDRLADRIEALRASEEASPRVALPGPAATAIISTPDDERHAEPSVAAAQPSLPTPFVEEQRSALVFEETRLESQLASLRAQDPSARQSDKGFAEMEVIRTLELRLGQVVEALARIDDGTYGFCTRCGNAIELERLEAVPSTGLCRSCSSLGA